MKTGCAYLYFMPKRPHRTVARLEGTFMNKMGLPALEPLTDNVKEEVSHLLEAYCDRLHEIAQAHTLSKHPGIEVI